MRNKVKYMFGFFVALAVTAFILPVNACNSDNEPANPSEPSKPDISVNGADVEQLLKVSTNPSMDEVLLDYEGFTVSYNPTMHLPNWVAWTITRDKLNASNLERVDNFRPDPKVPGCATLADYKYSGYDRGHMAPSGDMRWSADAMDQACYLTNICPQLHELNNGAWKYLEEKCRDNARRDSLVIVVCGPVLTQGFTKYIGQTPVPVPDKFFKVVLTPGGVAGPQAIGFIMPNGTVEGGMQKAAVTVDEVEALTGHDFFYALPDAQEKQLESSLDFPRFSTGKSSKRATH